MGGFHERALWKLGVEMRVGGGRVGWWLAGAGWWLAGVGWWRVRGLSARRAVRVGMGDELCADRRGAMTSSAGPVVVARYR